MTVPHAGDGIVLPPRLLHRPARDRRFDLVTEVALTDQLYPIAVKVADRLVVVVGGGPVAAFKVEGLLRCAARVRVVAPELTRDLRDLAAQGRIEWVERSFEPGDLDGALLAVAATGDAEINREVADAAHALNLLVNAVDDPQQCDYYLPAVARRGSLHLTVCTGGAAPAFASVLRDELEQQLQDNLDVWVDLLAEARNALRRRYPDDARQRHRAARELALSPARQAVARGEIEVARRLLGLLPGDD